MTRIVRIGLALLGGPLALLAAASSHAATIVLTPVADTTIRRDINTTTNYGADGILDVLENGTTRDYKGYVRFDLSALGGATINSAAIQLTKVAGGSRNDTIVSGRIALSGLDATVGNTAQNWGEAALTYDTAGADRGIVNVTSFDDNVPGITEALTASATIVTVSGAPVVTFLQGRMSSLDNPNLATIIVDFPTAGTAAGTLRGFAFGTKENATTSAIPTLTIDYTPVPEPGACILATLGVVAGLGARRRS